METSGTIRQYLESLPAELNDVEIETLMDKIIEYGTNRFDVGYEDGWKDAAHNLT